MITLINYRGTLSISDGTVTEYVTSINGDFEIRNNSFFIQDLVRKKEYYLGPYTNVNGFSSANDLKLYLSEFFSVNVNAINTAPPFFVKFNRITNTTTLTEQPNIGATLIKVASATGISAGSYIILFDPANSRFYFGSVISVATLDITLDTPLDYSFPITSTVEVAIKNLGGQTGTLASPTIFKLRGATPPDNFDVQVVVTRLMFKCTASSAVDLNKFGNLARLTNGLVLRKVDGIYVNYFNIKDNGELANLCYDWIATEATNPVQGVDGYLARLTFTRLGTNVILNTGDNLEILIQDSLVGLTNLEIIAEGYTIPKII